MFDLATRPQPAPYAAAALAVPFDWRLVQPLPAAELPYTDYLDPAAGPTQHTELLATYALELEDTLQTAVILSLFTDRRAGRDDVLPLNQTDRRGWVGDEFMGGGFDAGTDAWGSGLWLLYSGKVIGDVLPLAQLYARESLAWMLRAGIVDRIDVDALWAGERADRLAVRPKLYKPSQVQPVYDVLWGTSIRRWSERGIA
jgi:phage gp46-like protein